MKVTINLAGEPLEELELSIKDIQPFIDLVKNHGYMDAEGTLYDFDDACVEHRSTVAINVIERE